MVLPIFTTSEYSLPNNANDDVCIFQGCNTVLHSAFGNM